MSDPTIDFYYYYHPPTKSPHVSLICLIPLSVGTYMAVARPHIPWLRPDIFVRVSTSCRAQKAAIAQLGYI